MRTKSSKLGAEGFAAGEEAERTAADGQGKRTAAAADDGEEEAAAAAGDGNSSEIVGY